MERKRHNKERRGKKVEKMEIRLQNRLRSERKIQKEETIQPNQSSKSHRSDRIRYP